MGQAAWDVSTAEAARVCSVQIDFGTRYFGEELERTVYLFNNGPVERQYMMIYDTPTEIKKKLDEAEGSSAADDADDPYAGFIMAARQKVCSNGLGEQLVAVARCSRGSGFIPGSGTCAQAGASLSERNGGTGWCCCLH